MKTLSRQLFLFSAIALVNQAAHAQILNDEGGLSAAPAAPTSVTGGGPYVVVVSDFDRSVEFYNAVLDVEPESGNLENYVSNAAISTLYNAEGGEFRNANYALPDTDLALELIGWRGTQAPPSVDDRMYDAGSTQLIVFVKDLDATVDAAVSNGGSVLTPGGTFSNEAVTAAAVQDPDGFFITLLESLTPPNTSIEGNAIHGRFRFSVADAERTADFYREAFGFDIPEVEAYSETSTPDELTGYDVTGNRLAFGVIPGSNVNFEINEYVADDKQAVAYSLPAPGSPVLRLLFNSLEDLEAALQRALAAGATLADNNVEPVALVETVLMITIKDPNGLFLELATGF